MYKEDAQYKKDAQSRENHTGTLGLEIGAMVGPQLDLEWSATRPSGARVGTLLTYVTAPTDALNT